MLDKEEKQENNISNAKTSTTTTNNAITAGNDNQVSDVDDSTKDAHDSGVKMLS